MAFKNVLITGATGYLGQKVAKKCVENGDSVVLSGLNGIKLRKITNDLRKTHKDNHLITFLEMDLSNDDPKYVGECLDSVGIAFDCVANIGAMQGPIGAFLSNSWDLFSFTMKTNFYAPLLIIKHLLPNMIERGYGRIVNISGGGATSARPNFTAYASSKVALVRFSETLAEEVKDFGVTVNCVAPGIMKSNMLKEIVSGECDPGEKELQIVKDALNKDTDSSDEAAELIAFLMSEESSNINGRLISAVWDDWRSLKNKKLDENLFKLRRVTNG